MSGTTKLRDLQAGTSGMMDSTAMETEEYYNQEGGEGEWSQKVDTGQLCRVCANPNEYLIPIFDGEGLEHELAMKIQKHLPIKVTETDTLPLHICYQCASTLIAWHDLVISCVEADKKLRELQVEDEDDDDDKGAEMFESHSMDSDPADEVDQPSTSEVQTQITKAPPSKKATPTKEKKPKLKMVLVKGPLAGTSGQKTGMKTQLAKALEQAKSKEGGNEDSASERCSELSNKEIEHLISPKEELLSNEVVADGYETCAQAHTQDVCDDLCAYQVFGPIDYKEMNVSELSSTTYLKDHDYIVNADCFSEDFECQERGNSSCHKEFSSDKLLRKHLDEEHTDIIDLSCEICNEMFESEYLLEVHKRTHDRTVCCDDDENVHLCDTCGKMFNTAGNLQLHEKRTHSEDTITQGFGKKHMCEVCGLSFQYNKYLKKHMLKHGEKNFVCETCGKRFETYYKLKMHQECHSEERPYVCNICGCTYKRYRNVLSHEKEVHGIFKLGPGRQKESLSFGCEICKKEFTTPQRASAHMRVHTGERPFHCEECGNSFRIYQSLMYHRRVVHEGRKVYGNKGNFPCVICKKVFSTKHYRKEHMHIHTGERPYVCKVCGRSFSHNTSLVQHTALHSDIRPYPCEFCKKAFRRRETLIIHIRTHTGEKPYICDVCGRGFAQLTDMKKHKLKIHKICYKKKS